MNVLRPPERSWCPPGLKSDEEIKEIFDRTVNYICPEIDARIDALRKSSPENDLFIVIMEDFREVLASVRQGMLDLAVLAAQRKGLPGALNPDTTPEVTIQRRRSKERAARERLAILPEDHPAAPKNWNK